MNIFIRQNGVIGGVCGGLSKSLGVHVAFIRLIFIVLCLATFGTSLLVYFFAMLSFPDVINTPYKEQPVFLGSCHKCAKSVGLHETWLRFFVLLASALTAFLPVFVIYVITSLVLGGTDEGTKGFSSSDSDVRDVN